MKSISLWKVVIASFRFFSRPHFAVGIGIAAATAVIVGALVVGDSVRASLRDLVLDRLGNVQMLLHARTFFGPEVLEQSAASLPDNSTLVSLILLPSSTVEKRADEGLLRASQVQVLAVDEDFWSAAPTSSKLRPASWSEDEVAINAALARELNAGVGDEITVRLRKASGVPADNPLGSREDNSINLPRQRIVAVLPDESVGSLSFQSTQSVVRNVFCFKATVQDALEVGSTVNAALVTSNDNAVYTLASMPALTRQATERLKPSIEDYGLQFQRITRVFPDPKIDTPVSRDDAATPDRNSTSPADETASDATSGERTVDGKLEPQTIYDYYELTSSELVIDRTTSMALTMAFDRRSTRLMTYLLNTITKIQPAEADLAYLRRSDPISMDSNSLQTKVLGRPVPYSIIVGVADDSELELEKYLQLDENRLRQPLCWINSWLAEQLDAKPGDWLSLTYFEPETIDGVEVERETRLMVSGVVPITEPVRGFVRSSKPASFDKRPTIFNDPNLTPTVPGLTDKDSISNWDAPFELNTDIILPVDDSYYANHRLTPKIFIPYHFAASPSLFGSRFGNLTALRFPAVLFPSELELREQIESALLKTRDEKGFAFVPVRSQLLRSASGTTPFDMLFLSLSFFVIVAALLLVTLLFRLGIQQRASQLGLLAAQGFSSGRIRSLLLRELSLVAVAGAAGGIFLGLIYARTMIAALQTWWIGAISSPFLQFAFSWQSLAIGATAGTLMSLATIYLSIRRMSSLEPLTLLRGQSEVLMNERGKVNRVALVIAGFLALCGLGLIVAGAGQNGMARAGMFFGSGMLLLLSSLLAMGQLLALAAFLGAKHPGRSSIFTLAWRAICRNPLRSTLALGLLAVASFLIASMGVFHVSANPRGYGGFNLIGQSSSPIYRNLSSTQTREQALGQQAELLQGTTILPLRIRPGEDASCNNLFQVAQPVILGVPSHLAEMHAFSSSSVHFDWAVTGTSRNPWSALANSATGDQFSPIPVILDQNTAAWSLKQGASFGSLIRLQYGDRTLYFQTVGLLSNSVLQGKLLIGEENFQTLFPEISGYGFFLIRSADDQDPQVVAQVLEQGWSGEGLDITSSSETLEKLLGVQNTYISAFQSLGALGLLLGTFGLVAVQLRSVLERRRELALMQAVGFSRNKITRMLTIETALLMAGGMLIGVLASAIALVPYVVENSSQVSALNPLIMLLLVLCVGFGAALIAVRAAMRETILSGLRSQ